MAVSSLPRREQGLSWEVVALVVSCALTASVPPVLAEDARVAAYGRHLARECTTCHRLDGTDNGIPSIVAWPTDTFVSTLKFYRDGVRANPVMVSVASSLSDEQMEALAVFFASVPKPAKKAPAPGQKSK